MVLLKVGCSFEFVINSISSFDNAIALIIAGSKCSFLILENGAVAYGVSKVVKSGFVKLILKNLGYINY